MKPGYYLVTPNGERRFISARVSHTALEALCDRYLTESNGWQYWVDYYHGLDIQDRPHWANWDHTDLFLDSAARACGEID